MCPDQVTRLHQHLMTKHSFSEKDAKLKESELRVMFLWSRKEKHGVAKPLPCEICGQWMLRLDNHLKAKHKMDSIEVKETLHTMREKYWSSGSVPLQHISSTGACKEDHTIPKRSKTDLSNMGPTVDYLPPNAEKITEKQKKEWGISNDDFLMYYESGSSLLGAFQDEVAKKKGLLKALRSKQHVHYLWTVVDPETVVLPQSALGNVLLVEDKYHNPTYSMIGNGGCEASTLRVRFTALRAFIRFMRRRKVFGGMSRATMSSLLEYVDEWNADFTEHIAQRKTDLRKIKVKRLMTPSHMIKYGRSNHVRSISTYFQSKRGQKLTVRYAQQIRDYLISNMCFMNGLRSSNILELRVKDVEDAKPAEGYPGYMSFINSHYKTSTIYGEKVIVLPNTIFKNLMCYSQEIRSTLNPSSNKYLFVSTDADRMTHGAIGSAITSSFKLADVFSGSEYKRVCPTRIRISCATFGCKAEGIDSGYFAKHFMKNKEDTTNTYYNLFSNHREALKLAMMMGDTFEVGGQSRIIKKDELDELTAAIHDSEKHLPSKETILKWVREHGDVDSKEMAEFVDTLKELELGAASFYGEKRKKLIQNKMPTKKRKSIQVSQHFS